MKILFADDNYLSREIAKSLEKENESYTIASNGKKALSAIDQGINNGDHFDLIFLFLWETKDSQMTFALSCSEFGFPLVDPVVDSRYWIGYTTIRLRWDLLIFWDLF